MKLRIACTLAVLIAGVVAAPSLKASTVTFTYTGQPVTSTTVTGFGSFSYNGSLTSIGLGDLTAFAFELDLTNSSSIPTTAIFDFALNPDLLTFSATVSGGAVTALSLTTDSVGASNTSNFDETQKELIVTSLGTNNAAIDSFIEIGTPHATGYDIGTINAQVVPEPSTWLMTGGAALLLFVWRRRVQSTKA